MPQAATPPGLATGGRDPGDAKQAKCLYTESDPIGYAWQAMSYESEEVLGPRAMARCAVGLLGDDDDVGQIAETSFERKVVAAFMPQAAAVAALQAMEEDIVECAEPAAKASAVVDSAAGPRCHSTK